MMNPGFGYCFFHATRWDFQKYNEYNLGGSVFSNIERKLLMPN